MILCLSKFPSACIIKFSTMALNLYIKSYILFYCYRDLFFAKFFNEKVINKLIFKFNLMIHNKLGKINILVLLWNFIIKKKNS